MSYAGHRKTYTLAPLVVGWDTAPPQLTSAALSGTTLTWQANDPGTPWLALAIDLVDPAGVNPPQTLDLGQLPPQSGTLQTTQVPLPPGTWNATLRATNSAGLMSTPSRSERSRSRVNLSLPMRYVVTGAAGFIGSHLAQALQAAGHDVTGVDCFTDYYDPAEKEENARGLDVLRLDLAEELARPPRCRRRLPSRRAGGRPQLRRRLPPLRAPEPDRDAARARGVRARQTCASSSPRRRPCTARPRRIRRRRTRGRARSRRTGSRSSACEQLAYAYRADAVVLRYFTVYGPRQRPDMFFRRVCEALLAGGAFEIYGTGEQSRSFTYVGDAVAATIAAMERAPTGAVYNVGGGDEASMLEAIALLEQVSGRELDVRHVDAAQGDVSRTKADITRIHAALGWAPETTLPRRVGGDVVVGLG